MMKLEQEYKIGSWKSMACLPDLLKNEVLKSCEPLSRASALLSYIGQGLQCPRTLVSNGLTVIPTIMEDANRMVDGKRQLVAWNEDDLKVSHEDSKVNRFSQGGRKSQVEQCEHHNDEALW